jgi:hypothetical protein
MFDTRTIPIHPIPFHAKSSFFHRMKVHLALA